jgi:hypothetical protein
VLHHEFFNNYLILLNLVLVYVVSCDAESLKILCDLKSGKTNFQWRHQWTNRKVLTLCGALDADRGASVATALEYPDMHCITSATGGDRHTT